MKYQDILAKSDGELETLANDTRKQLQQLMIDMRTQQVADVKQAAKLKKTIARALTVRRQRQIEAGGNNG